MNGPNDNFALEHAELDMFNGMTLNLVENECSLSSSEFAQQFEGALAEWRGEGRRGIWVYVPLKKVRACVLECVRCFILVHVSPPLSACYSSECVRAYGFNHFSALN